MPGPARHVTQERRVRNALDNVSGVSPGPARQITQETRVENAKNVAGVSPGPACAA